MRYCIARLLLSLIYTLLGAYAVQTFSLRRLINLLHIPLLVYVSVMQPTIVDIIASTSPPGNTSSLITLYLMNSHSFSPLIPLPNLLFLLPPLMMISLFSLSPSSPPVCGRDQLLLIHSLALILQIRPRLHLFLSLLLHQQQHKSFLLLHTTPCSLVAKLASPNHA